MEKIIADNHSKLKLSYYVFPSVAIVLFITFLYLQKAFSSDSYIAIQQNSFFYVNSKLSQYPKLIYNLTQLGDAFIFLSILTFFLFYAPIIWEALISASLISLIFSTSLKNWFAVPRPAAVFEHNSFAIIGKVLPGYSSLPSGHSITIFTVLTVLLFSFVFKNGKIHFASAILIILTGLSLAFTRVGVGAHYPLDVIAGSIIGYVSGITGIFISRKYKLWFWLYNKQFYPVLALLLITCSVILIQKIMADNLPIYYLSFSGLIFSLYKITDAYIKKGT